MTKEHFERWIKDPEVALSELKEEIRRDPDAVDSWRIDDILQEAGIDTEEMDVMEQKMAAAEILYNSDEGDVLFYELFNDADKLSYSIYEANIYGERSEESGSLSMTRTKGQVVVFTACDWGVEERESYNAGGFSLEPIIWAFINEAEEYAAMDYPSWKKVKPKNYTPTTSGSIPIWTGSSLSRRSMYKLIRGGLLPRPSFVR